MSYLIEWKENNVILTFSGDTSTLELINANNEIFDDQRFYQMKYQLCDFRGLRTGFLRNVHVDVLANLDRRTINWNSQIKIAMVAIEPAHIKLCDDYIALMKSTPWETRCFGTYEEAVAWCKEVT